jgi:hypothetical protein
MIDGRSADVSAVPTRCLRLGTEVRASGAVATVAIDARLPHFAAAAPALRPNRGITQALAGDSPRQTSLVFGTAGLASAGSIGTTGSSDAGVVAGAAAKIAEDLPGLAVRARPLLLAFLLMARAGATTGRLRAWITGRDAARRGPVRAESHPGRRGCGDEGAQGGATVGQRAERPGQVVEPRAFHRITPYETSILAEIVQAIMVECPCRVHQISTLPGILFAQATHELTSQSMVMIHR